jgi:hypothetical protein
MQVSVLKYIVVVELRSRIINSNNIIKSIEVYNNIIINEGDKKLIKKKLQKQNYKYLLYLKNDKFIYTETEEVGKCYLK